MLVIALHREQRRVACRDVMEWVIVMSPTSTWLLSQEIYRAKLLGYLAKHDAKKREGINLH